MEVIKGYSNLTGSIQTKRLVFKEQEDDSSIGLIVIPPVEGDTSEEMESYPKDYIEYSLERMKQYREETGQLPEWEHST